MATVNKNFRVKSGLVVEGTTGTINGLDILTKKQADQDYIIGLIGGTATSTNTADAVVKRDGSGNFAAGTVTADLVGDVTGNADTATALENPRTIELTGNVTGSVSFDGTQNVQISTTIDGSFATDSEVATAKQEAIDAAEDYTDAAVAGAIGDIPTNTDELPEGTTNLYYTDTRARAALSEGDGINYNSSTGVISAEIGNGLELDGSAIVVDTDIIATKQFVADEIDAHNDAVENVHGVVGEVVGTENIQPLRNKILSDGTELGVNLNAAGYRIVDLAEPVNAGDAATKGYVDAVAEGLHIHASVSAATNVDVDLAAAGEDTVDGVNLVAGNRVLVRAQSLPEQNGIYVVSATGWTRAEDHNTAGEVQAGDFVFVDGGTSYGNTGWVLRDEVAVLGTDPLFWTQFSGAGTFLAGNGLQLNSMSSNTFEVDFTLVAAQSDLETAVQDHEALDTGIHGLGTSDGVFVGTDKTQTLTNKTLGTGTSLGENLDATFKQIKNLGMPTDSNDATDKSYVDGQVNLVSQAVEDLTTDNVPESIAPTNRYFTDERAELAVATFLNSATLTNLTFNGSPGSYVLAAENGVAESTTDDLVEGDDNFYFTDARAKSSSADMLANSVGTRDGITITQGVMPGTVDIVVANALEDATTDDVPEAPDNPTNLYFTTARARAAMENTNAEFASVTLNDGPDIPASKIVAVTEQVSTASVADVFYWQLLDGDGDINTGVGFTAAEFLVKVSSSVGTELTKVLFTSDDQYNGYITEYGMVSSHSGTPSSISVDVTNSQVRTVSLQVTTVNNNSTVTVIGTLLR